MTLIKSISGIRGTIGGKTQENLTPLDTVLFASAYASWLKSSIPADHYTVVVGRDARISGKMVQSLVNETLVGMGIDVIDLGLSTTPTVEMSVVELKAHGGIIITASHNPMQWNALKLLNNKGEFLNENSGMKILEIAESQGFNYASVEELGKITPVSNSIESHIEQVLSLPIIQLESIKKAKFKVIVDAVNSTGGIALPILLNKLNVEVVELYCTPDGNFPHNPEPLKEHLGELCNQVLFHKADFGIVVDPDVDRLAFVDEKGEMFGEEYTLVACADYVLSKKSGNTVSNLSSTRALADITNKYGGTYHACAVGEVNVVEKMKEVNAVIGGEGNGGIIYPELHYGRDALVGIGIFLSLLSENQLKVSELRSSYPAYFMSKTKVNLDPKTDVSGLLIKMKEKYSKQYPIMIDGVKIEFDNAWVHLRISNTEPIIRVYTEAPSQVESDDLAKRFLEEIETNS
jgi:phosphomannomutase